MCGEKHMISGGLISEDRQNRLKPLERWSPQGGSEVKRAMEMLTMQCIEEHHSSFACIVGHGRAL